MLNAPRALKSLNSGGAPSAFTCLGTHSATISDQRYRPTLSGGAPLLCCASRIGGASALFNQGVSPEFIKAIGRWWSGAYLLYIRQMQGNAQKMMVEACSQPCEYLEATPDDNQEGDEE